MAPCTATRLGLVCNRDGLHSSNHEHYNGRGQWVLWKGNS